MSYIDVLDLIMVDDPIFQFGNPIQLQDAPEVATTSDGNVNLHSDNHQHSESTTMSAVNSSVNESSHVSSHADDIRACSIRSLNSVLQIRNDTLSMPISGLSSSQQFSSANSNFEKLLSIGTQFGRTLSTPSSEPIFAVQNIPNLVFELTTEELASIASACPQLPTKELALSRCCTNECCSHHYCQAIRKTLATLESS
jgi:hypothetical protein